MERTTCTKIRRRPISSSMKVRQRPTYFMKRIMTPSSRIILTIAVALFILLPLHISATTILNKPQLSSSVQQVPTSNNKMMITSTNTMIIDDPKVTHEKDVNYLRRRQQQQQQQQTQQDSSSSWQKERQLPGGYEGMGDIDFESAEAGFIVGFLFLIVLLFLCLCCCCCGGGRRRPYGYNNGGGGGSNCLWDLVAIVCLWEMCCDNDGIMGDGFMRF